MKKKVTVFPVVNVCWMEQVGELNPAALMAVHLDRYGVTVRQDDTKQEIDLEAMSLIADQMTRLTELFCDGGSTAVYEKGGEGEW